MGFDELLLHRCSIQRFVAAGVDEYNQPTGSWIDLVTEVPCRLWLMTGREIENIHKETVFSRHKLFLRDTDITEMDRIADIAYVGGTVFDAGPFEIVFVQERHDKASSHHLELWLTRVKGG